MSEGPLLFNPADFPALFSEADENEVALAPLRHPIWTRHKARLIERYLYYFVLITKHGTYIDGFAGPQKEGESSPDSWAAKLVLESEPRWLRNFHLVDQNKAQVERLSQLVLAQPDKPRRSIHVYEGSFNKIVSDILTPDVLKTSEATFCLLDQRTFECEWATLVALSNYKLTAEHKIELFYFLPIGWLDRALSAQRDYAVLEKWWGRTDWDTLENRSARDRANLFCDRMRVELGYRYVLPWPIYEDEGSSRIMYYMIHASDHSEAPRLMRRAYHRAVSPREPAEQFLLDFGNTSR